MRFVLHEDIVMNNSEREAIQEIAILIDKIARFSNNPEARRSAGIILTELQNIGKNIKDEDENE